MAEACCRDWPCEALVRPEHVFIHRSLAAAASTALGVYLTIKEDVGSRGGFLRKIKRKLPRHVGGADGGSDGAAGRGGGGRHRGGAARVPPGSRGRVQVFGKTAVTVRVLENKKRLSSSDPF